MIYRKPKDLITIHPERDKRVFVTLLNKRSEFNVNSAILPQKRIPKGQVYIVQMQLSMELTIKLDSV